MLYPAENIQSCFQATRVVDGADRCLQVPRTQPTTAKDAAQPAVYEWGPRLCASKCCLPVFAPLSPPPGRRSCGGEAEWVGTHSAASASARMWLLHTLLCVTSKSASGLPRRAAVPSAQPRLSVCPSVVCQMGSIRTRGQRKCGNVSREMFYLGGEVPRLPQKDL